MAQIEAATDLIWVILYRTEYAGCCGLHDIASKKPQFGIWIKYDFQGPGLASKIVPYVLHWSLKNLELEYIRYPVDQRNTRSIQIIES